MASIAQEYSLFEIDRELDMLLDAIEEEIENRSEASTELLDQFQQFCEAHGEKADRIGRFLRMMEARVQYWRCEPPGRANALKRLQAAMSQYAAIASVADCVPLQNGTRALARLGMRELGRVDNWGLRELPRVSCAAPANPVCYADAQELLLKPALMPKTGRSSNS